MNSPALLLAIGMPAASAVSRGVAATTQAVGDSFKRALDSVSGSQAAGTSGSSAKVEPTLREKLGGLAAELQDWLRSQGISDDYSIDYRLEGSGEQQVDVAGTAAEKVKQLLAARPEWLTQLRQIAASLQAQTSVFSHGSSLDATGIMITDTDFRLS